MSDQDFDFEYTREADAENPDPIGYMIPGAFVLASFYWIRLLIF